MSRRCRQSSSCARSGSDIFNSSVRLQSGVVLILILILILVLGFFCPPLESQFRDGVGGEEEEGMSRGTVQQSVLSVETVELSAAPASSGNGSAVDVYRLVELQFPATTVAMVPRMPRPFPTVNVPDHAHYTIGSVILAIGITGMVGNFLVIYAFIRAVVKITGSCHSHSSSRDSVKSFQRLQNEWKMAKIALIVILLYVISWSPYSTVALTAFAGTLTY
ncbi:hypothetical protein INR49_010246 [Caranx melampygus]|nr:hypothetical protein INR49_010246 [Caranx melampygus]